MARLKKATTPPEEKVESNIPESEEKKKFRELIETYKEQNPVKYAQKMERLAAKLKSMK